MNFKLNDQNGKVKYLARQNGAVIGSDMPVEVAVRLLNIGSPERSEEHTGYPVAVSVQNIEYFFSGEWLMGGARNVLSEDAPESAGNAPCGPDYCEIDAGEGHAEKPQKKRRTNH